MGVIVTTGAIKSAEVGVSNGAKAVRPYGYYSEWEEKSESAEFKTMYSRFVCLFVSFVCLFFVIKPENPYFASRFGLEVNSPGVYPLGPRSPSCSPANFLFFLGFYRHTASAPITPGRHTGGVQ